MSELSAPSFRFRSELASRHNSVLTVVVVYLLGASILFGMTHFLVSFYQFDEALGQAELIERRSAALDRLNQELAASNSQTGLEKVVAEFEQDLEGLELSPAPGSGFDVDDRNEGAGLGGLIRLHAEGAPQAIIREEAARLVTAEKSLAQAARRHADNLKDRMGIRAIFLAAVILLNVFGGGILFLRRWHNLERLLQERTRELEEVDSSRRLFFATASHELRTPVTVMMGEAEVALSGEGELDEAREALRHIAAHAKFLGHRIEEMIAIARTSDGKLHLDARLVDYREVVSSAVNDARLFAASVESELDMSLPDQRIMVIGDALWLKRALLAVIENALKFSPINGKITIALVAREEFAEVTVTDRGPGVMPEELPLIFKAYYQTELGRTRGGTGLGLSMTRWIAEQHGGRAYARNLGSWRNPDGCSVAVLVKRERGA